ncbi:MAG TPA: MG2 domain-containing protein, partial [Chitinophagaceae bacterium]|nr:MG2 domain-containing protein [Chitinophagaceae bacterium]
MTRFTYFLLLILLSATVFAQTKQEEYNARWRQINSLAGKSFPQSALTAVQEVYDLAAKEGNEPQRIRALVYRLYLQSNHRDTALLHNIKVLKEESMMANGTARSVLLSMLAEAYLRYFQQHRWQLYNRTRVAPVFQQNDVATWSTADFHNTITSLYLESISNEVALKRTRLQYLEPLIDKGSLRHLRPSLFDLLAHRAIEYFKNEESSISKPAYAFKMDDAAVFAPPAAFATHTFVSRDSLSLHHKVLVLYQRLTKMHVGDANPSALVDLTIQRLQFANSYSILDNKDSLYAQALRQLAERYQRSRESSHAWYLLAELHADQARQYSRSRGDTMGRYEYLNAKAICEAMIARNDSSWGVFKCRSLLQEILKKDLRLTVERVNVPGKPFRALISYRNAAALHLRVIRLEDSIRHRITEPPHEDEFWEQLAALPYLRSSVQSLPLTDDHQEHSAEIKIDALPVGRYRLLGSADPAFGVDSNALFFHDFSVSDIAYVHNGNDVFVLHRETGKPLAGAKVTVDNDKTYTTNRYGHVNIKSSAENDENYNRYVTLHIKHGNDELEPGASAYLYRRLRSAEEDDYDDYDKDERDLFEEDHLRAYIFTDRAIYRPGQTVYFKGILITKDFKTRQWKIVPRFETTVYLEDANNQDADSVNVVTNEFGAYSGKFRIPENRMNGEYTIYDLDSEGEVEISVEEYKRPRFFIEEEKPAVLYRLNDTLQLKAFARAYTGNNIDGAIVKYRVVRQSNPRLRGSRLYYPRTNEQEIAHGEVPTGSDGGFVIKFPLLPDLSVASKLDPVFNFEVTLDVTDAAGETRSHTVTVQASYKTLRLAVDLPSATMGADSLKKIFVKTSNYADKFYPSLVNVSIYKLDAPQRLIRKRYWQQPDMFVMSEAEYLQHFPHDEYSNETNKDNWKKLEKVYDRNDSTKPNSIFRIGHKLTTGWYVIEVTATDKYGQPVKESKYIELINSRNGRPPSYRRGTGVRRRP